MRDVDDVLGLPSVAGSDTGAMSLPSARSTGGSTGGMSWHVQRSADFGRSAGAPLLPEAAWWPPGCGSARAERGF